MVILQVISYTVFVVQLICINPKSTAETLFTHGGKYHPSNAQKVDIFIRKTDFHSFLTLLPFLKLTVTIKTEHVLFAAFKFP